jgi:type II secretory ATPase GspE/PulE/Tfp pilus assembly ATPase PilB-like protein
LHRSRSSDNNEDPAAASQNSATFLRLALPYNLCRRLGVRPLRRVGKKLFVAATRSLTEAEKDELIIAARTARLDIDDVVIDPRDKKETLAVLRTETHVDEEALARKIDRLNSQPDEGVLLQQIIGDIMVDAAQSRASDIHVDNVEDNIGCWISYRIDGDLRYRYLMSPEASKRLSTRLKNDAGMDFSDTRRPQDGRFPFQYQGRQIDVRCAAMPIDGGETITMRLLDPESLLSLEDLFRDSPLLLRRMRALASIKNKTGGLVIISGPTGSGKTTTLYAIIRELDRHRLNVMTVEDPVEYRIPLVRQAQVVPEIGTTFSALLRAQLRHDPDILVVGELRDSITAETALRSAESGHFVLTTIHAADALQTIERLSGMFPPDYRHSGTYVLGHYLWAAVNQRLVKRVCAACKVPSTVKEAEQHIKKSMLSFSLDSEETVFLANPSGCHTCGYTGYRGRALLPETLFIPFDPELRHRIADYMLEGNTNDIKRLQGVIFQSRAESAAALLRRGVIDPEIALAGTESLESSPASAPNFMIADREPDGSDGGGITDRG